MDPNLILAALVLFIKMDVHHPATVKEKETLALDTHTLGGNNAANGIMVNANQRVTNVIFFFIFKSRAQPDVTSGSGCPGIFKCPDSGLPVFFLPGLRTYQSFRNGEKP